jgi:hypothetical protein
MVHVLCHGCSSRCACCDHLHVLDEAASGCGVADAQLSPPRLPQRCVGTLRLRCVFDPRPSDSMFRRKRRHSSSAPALPPCFVISAFRSAPLRACNRAAIDEPSVFSMGFPNHTSGPPFAFELAGRRIDTHQPVGILRLDSFCLYLLLDQCPAKKNSFRLFRLRNSDSVLTFFLWANLASWTPRINTAEGAVTFALEKRSRRGFISSG